MDEKHKPPQMEKKKKEIKLTKNEASLVIII